LFRNKLTRDHFYDITKTIIKYAFWGFMVIFVVSIVAHLVTLFVPANTSAGDSGGAMQPVQVRAAFGLGMNVANYALLEYLGLGDEASVEENMARNLATLGIEVTLSTEYDRNSTEQLLSKIGGALERENVLLHEWFRYGYLVQSDIHFLFLSNKAIEAEAYESSLEFEQSIIDGQKAINEIETRLGLPEQYIKKSEQISRQKLSLTAPMTIEEKTMKNSELLGVISDYTADLVDYLDTQVLENLN
jgi:hypothetical protein